MINYKTGNLFNSKADALVNTVNTQGVMGKGIALQFKNMFPNNYKIYYEICKNKKLDVGNLLVTEEKVDKLGKKIIINFPTKTTWRLPSEYHYIEDGLKELIKLIKEKNIKSIALPALGAGNGGLNWLKVKEIIENNLSNLDCDIDVFEPNNHTQKIKLTVGRAMLLSVLYEMHNKNEEISEFAAEKIVYFLQRFGAKDIFKLNFEPHFYGPYSGKVKNVLSYLNGSYIIGYDSKKSRPFEKFNILPNTIKEVNEFIFKPEFIKENEIINKTKTFLNDFYSPYNLELLSSIDYIITFKQAKTNEQIINELNDRNKRKTKLFTDIESINLAISIINKHL